MRLMPGRTLTRIPNLVKESGPRSSRREKSTILADYGCRLNRSMQHHINNKLI
jgi:hypothetical protein